MTQEQPLLASKFYMPPVRRRRVERPRLVDRLNTGLGLGRRLTLITAPAGYGKSTLAVEWLDQRDADPAVWLSLDEADNDPARFFAYFLAGLETAGLSVHPDTHALPAARPQPRADELAAALLADLNPAPAGAPARSAILALDDYHRIQNATVHMVLQALVEQPGLPLHILLMTREDPPLPLARWRVQGHMTEIRARDLRFTPAEVDHFLNRVMALGLEAEWVELLAARTEGWIAGLQLAALSLEGQADPTPFVERFAGDDRQVVDYLMEEVLARQPAPIHTFLLRTSILSRLCGSLCHALLEGNADIAPGHAILQELERRNLFLVPLDNHRAWYRYHHLFGDLLQQRLQMSADPGTVAGLHGRAARWYAEHGHMADAVHHAFAAEEFTLAADLVEQALAGASAWSGGRVGRLLGWWRALPADVVQARPELSLRFSRALYLAGYLPEAAELLDQAEAALQAESAAGAPVTALLAQAAVYRGALLAMHGETGRALEITHQALGRLPARDLLVRARAHDTLGMAHELCGAADDAVAAYTEAAALALRAGVLYLAINAHCAAARVRILQGRLRQAQQSCRTALELAGRDGDSPEPAPAGLAHVLLGEIRRERNDLAGAADALRRGIALAQAGGITDDLRYDYLFLARLCLSQGDEDGALAALHQADLLLQSYAVPRLAAQVAALRTRVWLAQGQTAAAARWAAAYGEEPPADSLRELEELTLVRVLLAQDQAEQAATRLHTILPPAQAAGRMGAVLEAQILLALALHRQAPGDPAALEPLEQALALAAPEGHVRIFLDEGAHMVDLLQQAHAQGRGDAYVAELLTAAGAAPAEPAAPAPQPAAQQDLVEPLTERELEVLALLAERLTNAEIAQRLVISLPTVKSHTTHIYAKLAVGDRRAAVARARQLGILTA